MNAWQDDDDPELDEDPDESDVDENDEADTRPCPYCGKQVYEHAELCPHCKSYISFENTASRRPLWIWITGIVLLAAMIYAAIRLLWFS